MHSHAVPMQLLFPTSEAWLQIFEYVQQDLKGFMGADKAKQHLPVAGHLLKVCYPCSTWQGHPARPYQPTTSLVHC